MAFAIVLPLPSFRTPEMVLSAVEIVNVFDVVVKPATAVVHTEGQPDTVTLIGFGMDQFGIGGGPLKPPDVPFGMAGPIPIPQLPFVLGIGMVVNVAASKASAPGVTVRTTNWPGPPANTSTVSPAVKVAAAVVSLTVKLMAEVVGVKAKSLVMMEVEVACTGVGMVLPKKSVVVLVGSINGSVKR